MIKGSEAARPYFVCIDWYWRGDDGVASFLNSPRAIDIRCYKLSYNIRVCK